MQTIITLNGQYVLTIDEVKAALGIPAAAGLIDVTIDSSSNTVTFTAVEQQSNTGTP